MNALTDAIMIHLGDISSMANTFLSPMSLYFCLSMIVNGAIDETQSEILRLFSSDDKVPTMKQLNNYNEEIIDSFNLEGKEPILTGYTFGIANSIWSRNSFTTEYDSVLRNTYKASIYPLESASKINDWVAEATNNKIEEIVKNLPPLTQTVIINALYFKGQWEYQFDTSSTTKENFVLASGKDKEVDMMHQKKFFAYATSKKFGQLLVLPYEYNSTIQPELEAMIILPPLSSSKSMNEFMETFSVDEIDSIREKDMYPQEIDLYLPKFAIEAEHDLVPILKKVGVSSIFSRGKGNMFNEDNSMKVDKMIQKVFVQVDEEGTEAAAVTAGIMKYSAIIETPEIMNCNRPFIFLIREAQNGITLFFGIVSHESHFSSK